MIMGIYFAALLLLISGLHMKRFSFRLFFSLLPVLLLLSCGLRIVGPHLIVPNEPIERIVAYENNAWNRVVVEKDDQDALLEELKQFRAEPVKFLWSTQLIIESKDSITCYYLGKEHDNGIALKSNNGGQYMSRNSHKTLSKYLKLIEERSHKDADDSWFFPLSMDLRDAVFWHIDEEKALGRSDYPDSVLCASIWFDYRGQMDSLHILEGPIPLYDDEFANPEFSFIGYLEGENILICLASLGGEKPKIENWFINTLSLKTDKEQYKTVFSAFTSHLSNVNVCSHLESTYYVNPVDSIILGNEVHPSFELVFDNRRLRR